MEFILIFTENYLHILDYRIQDPHGIQAHLMVRFRGILMVKLDDEQWLSVLQQLVHELKNIKIFTKLN